MYKHQSLSDVGDLRRKRNGDKLAQSTAITYIHTTLMSSSSVEIVEAFSKRLGICQSDYYYWKITKIREECDEITSSINQGKRDAITREIQRRLHRKAERSYQRRTAVIPKMQKSSDCRERGGSSRPTESDASNFSQRAIIDGKSNGKCH